MSETATIHDDLETLKRKGWASAKEWAERELRRVCRDKGLVECQPSDDGATEHYYRVQKTIDGNPANDIEYITSAHFRSPA